MIFRVIGNICLGASFLLLAACAMQPIYNVEISNVGAYQLRNVEVYWGEHALGVGGWLSPGQSKIQSRPHLDIPDFVTVRWQDESLVNAYEKIVEIDDSKFSEKEGFVTYSILEITQENEVSLRIVTCEEMLPCPEK